MYQIRLIEDKNERRDIWNRNWTASSIFDLWELRECFSSSFNRENLFIVLENDSEIIGILPLSWISESDYYSFFPGETWNGKTWLEENRVYAKDNEAFQILLDSIPTSAHMRYLCANSLYFNDALKIDEINYHLYPGEVDFSFEKYMMKFSSKSRKNLTREVEAFYKAGASLRFNDSKDIETLFEMNLESFGAESYFHDKRFFSSFINLIEFLQKNNMLKITSVHIGDTTAAVDIGTVYQGEYTVLAGGTNHEFTGIAKLINFHHIEWSCSNKMNKINFLSGDFGWKERFHLTQKPLYQIKLESKSSSIPAGAVTGTYGY